MPRRSRRFENPTFMPRGLVDGEAGAADAPLGARRNSRTTPSTIAIRASDVASTVRFAPPSACAVTCTDPAASSVRPKRSDPGSRPTILAPRWRRRFPKDANAWSGVWFNRSCCAMRVVGPPHANPMIPHKVAGSLGRHNSPVGTLLTGPGDGFPRALARSPTVTPTVPDDVRTPPTLACDLQPLPGTRSTGLAGGVARFTLICTG